MNNKEELTEEQKYKLILEESEYMFRGIKDNYNNFKDIKLEDNSIFVTFRDDFKMEIVLAGEYYFYFNDIFCCGIEHDEGEDVIDLIMQNQLVFCEVKSPFRGAGRKIIQAEYADEYVDSPKHIHTWTIEKTIK